MKVLLLSRYDTNGASSRVRSYQFLPHLAAAGIEVTVAPLLADAYLERLYASGRRGLGETFRAYFRRVTQLSQSKHYDLLWIEYELFPWLPAWFEDLFTSRIPPYVVDYDDAIFHRYNLCPNRPVRTLFQGKIEQVMRRAQLVIVGNNYLAEHARKAGAKNVAYLPSVVDTDRYKPSPRGENAKFTIGWIGSPMTSKFLNQIAPALEQVCRGDSARLVLVGANQGTVAGFPAEFRTWTENTEVAEIQNFDVGVMPLPDESFERGKCGYKLIQYMACGLPVVASPVGVNATIVEKGRNGFLADSQEEWVSAISLLQRDPKLRTAMGLAGRKKVEREYSLTHAAKKLELLLRSSVNDEELEESVCASNALCVE
ncbi:MAG: glycosyltransferase family 4 protein [Terriglobales bacterium]